MMIVNLSYKKRSKTSKKIHFPLFDINDFVNPKQPKKVEKVKNYYFFKLFRNILVAYNIL